MLSISTVLCHSHTGRHHHQSLMQPFSNGEVCCLAALQVQQLAWLQHH